MSLFDAFDDGLDKLEDVFETEKDIFGDYYGTLLPAHDRFLGMRADQRKGNQGPQGGPPQEPVVDTLLTAAGMPSLTDSDRRSAARKRMSDLRRRGGRASTILTDDPLGGGF